MIQGFNSSQRSCYYADQHTHEFGDWRVRCGSYLSNDRFRYVGTQSRVAEDASGFVILGGWYAKID